MSSNDIYPYFTKDVGEKMIADYESGNYSLYDIADKYGSTKYLCSKYLRASGAKKPTLYEKNKENIDKAVEYYKTHSEVTAEEMSKKLKISSLTFSRILEDKGAKRNRDRLSDKDIEKIKELKESGMRVTDIAKIFNRKVNAIYKAIYKTDIAKELDTGKIYALHQARWDNETIAYEMGLKKEAVDGIVRDFDNGTLKKPNATWRDKAECF